MVEHAQIIVNSNKVHLQMEFVTYLNKLSYLSKLKPAIMDPRVTKLHKRI